MPSHPFDSGAVRVQFKVEMRNERSQAALAKLAAVKREYYGATREHGPDIN
jgi:RimJ/RimL family protein N-acetyltransferase